MSEEEIIDKIEKIIIKIRTGREVSIGDDTAIQGLLDLYNKEKEKNKRYEKSLLYMINQFAYDEKRNKQEDEILYTGGLSALEEAFDVLNINEGIQRKDLWKMIQELLEEKEI